MLSLAEGMPERTRRRLAVDLPWRSLFRIVAVVAVVWVWLQLYQLALLVIVAVLLAVTLDPVVGWIEGRGLPRWGSASLVGLVLLAVTGGFFYFTWSSLSAQATMVGQQLGTLERSIVDRLPVPVRTALGGQTNDAIQSIGALTLQLVRALSQAVVVFALAFIVMLYLLIEGRQTYEWLVAFVPTSQRAKVEATATESQRVIFAYVAGNVATSVFATVFVLVVLSVLKVPAALLLAIVAGICDFVPVLGFILSSLPAVLVALTVSPTTALIVAGSYVLYHMIENYLIAPRVYGDQLRLSNLAVILAFTIGAELAGVVGALIALPIAAAYPAVERIWLREKLGADVVQQHRAIERKSA
jgi:predicted PurR-regulated permease PerM